jgi:hypothetical protein
MGPRPAADPWTRRCGMVPRRDQAGLMYPLLAGGSGMEHGGQMAAIPIIASASGRMGLPRPSSGRAAPRICTVLVTGVT